LAEAQSLPDVTATSSELPKNVAISSSSTPPFVHSLQLASQTPSVEALKAKRGPKQRPVPITEPEELVDCILVRYRIDEPAHPLYELNNRIERIELKQIVGFSDQTKNSVRLEIIKESYFLCN
jgi:hypothetical protein